MAEEKKQTNNSENELEFTEDAGSVAPNFKVQLKKLREELKKCEAERKEYLEGWQRAKADYINYTKDENKRFEEMTRIALSTMIYDLLPVLDSFDLALLSLSSGKERKDTDIKGVMLLRSQLMDILKKRGLEEIKVEAGDEFNPEQHESVGESETSGKPGTIAEVIQKGYILQNKVIRPARVKIVKNN